MIYVVVPEDGRFGIENYRTSRWRDPDSPQVTAVSYAELFASTQLAAGTWIFTSPERLSPSGRMLAGEAFRALAGSGQRVLNEPTSIPTRHELLERMREAGINDFRSHPANRLNRRIRYPVFVRKADLHAGSMSGLIHGRSELRRFLWWQRLSGTSLASLLVVEFCDVSGGSGEFRKYSAFFVCGEVVARYLHVNRNWMVKAPGAHFEDAWAAQELDYVLRNPHREDVRRVFGLAGIDYGRIDYGLVDGRIRVWEINTNPTFGPGPGGTVTGEERERRRVLQEPAKRYFYTEFSRLLNRVDSPGGACVPFRPPERLLRQWRHETALADLVERRRLRRQALAASPLVGPCVRGVKRLLSVAS